jgi:hypothetical protein
LFNIVYFIFKKGDESYGNKDWNKKLLKSDSIRRPLLHAYKIEFEHPFQNKKITLQAPLPNDMKNLINKIAVVSKKESIIDINTNLLTVKTDVNTEISISESKGFVPYDRFLFKKHFFK